MITLKTGKLFSGCMSELKETLKGNEGKLRACFYWAAFPLLPICIFVWCVVDLAVENIDI